MNIFENKVKIILKISFSQMETKKNAATSTAVIVQN